MANLSIFKGEVIIMIKNIQDEILKLKKIPKLDDTSDALACAITAFYFSKNKK